jgi:hypothetical protein
MKSPTKMKIATFGGAAALALAVGFGGVSAGLVGNTPATTTHASSHAAPAPAPGAVANGGAGVHTATLTGCVTGLDC